MENNSIKLRLLLTLQALIKYSDENHKLTSTRLNKYLQPYGFQRSKKALRDTVAVLRDFGLDIGKRGCGGVWLKDSILPSDKLRTIVYAISTNPYISSEQAGEALKALTPFVTVYQEPLLNSIVQNLSPVPLDKDFFNKYCTIVEAIETNKRLVYSYYDRNKQGGEVVYKESDVISFFPAKIYQYDNKIYMTGYNYKHGKIEKVDISTISFIELAKNQGGESIDIDIEKLNDFDFSSLFIV